MNDFWKFPLLETYFVPNPAHQVVFPVYTTRDTDIVNRFHFQSHSISKFISFTRKENIIRYTLYLFRVLYIFSDLPDFNDPDDMNTDTYLLRLYQFTVQGVTLLWKGQVP